MLTPQTELSQKVHWAPSLVGILLIVSAFLKAEQLIAEAYYSDNLLFSFTLVVIQIECELLLGVWLLSNVYQRYCRYTSILVFSCFAMVAFAKVLDGHRYCGCFGRLQINPWWTLFLDAIVIVTLVNWNTSECIQIKSSPSRTRLCFVFFTMLLVCFFSVILFTTTKPSLVDKNGVDIERNGLVVLEPESWIGEDFPIADYIDIGEILNKGHWNIIFYRHDCPKCHDVFLSYGHLKKDLIQPQTDLNVAFIELPPYGIDKKSNIYESWCKLGRMSDQYDWLVKTPLEINLHNGSVISVIESY